MRVSKKKKNLEDKKSSSDGISKKSKIPMKKQKAISLKKEVVVKSVDSSEAVFTKMCFFSDELQRKRTQGERSIYIKFKGNLPSTTEEIKELHPDIKFVRNHLLSKKSTTIKELHYAFLEFETAELCKNAMTKLTTTQFRGQDVFVEFECENSKNVRKDNSDYKELNPTRLFVCGLAPGMTKSSLKEMFPKAAHADVPNNKISKSFGFVQFSNADDAKDAFDATQNLSIDGHKITVLFSKTSATKGEVKQKKVEKRKVRKPRGASKIEGGLGKKEGSVGKKDFKIIKTEKVTIKTEQVNIKTEKFNIAKTSASKGKVKQKKAKKRKVRKPGGASKTGGLMTKEGSVVKKDFKKIKTEKVTIKTEKVNIKTEKVKIKIEKVN